MIEGLSHITLLTRDLDEMERVLTGVFDAKRVYDSGKETNSLSPERFYLIGQQPDSVWLAAMQGEAPPASYQHIAFKIDDADYDNYLEKIAALGLVLRPSRPRISGEARSIYFYDDDGHLFELHTGTLQQRLRAYLTHP